MYKTDNGQGSLSIVNNGDFSLGAQLLYFKPNCNPV